MSCGQGGVGELASWGAVEATVYEDNIDFGAFLHERIEVQCIRRVAESARLVVSSHDVHASALDSIDQGEESLTAFQLAAADIEVTEDFDLVARRHGRQGEAMLLLDLRRNRALAFLVARLPDVDERNPGVRRLSRSIHRLTAQHA